ncbi:hypothetical protein BHE74_00025966 [Ensete ventricosum]|nr:hypothetical protein BHE74_00025966 [Ensete ventricosum]
MSHFADAFFSCLPGYPKNLPLSFVRWLEFGSEAWIWRRRGACPPLVLKGDVGSGRPVALATAVPDWTPDRTQGWRLESFGLSVKVVEEAFNGITQGVISSSADSALSEGTSGTLMAVGAVGHHLLSLSHLVESTIVGCLPRVTFASASSFPGRGLMPASSFREVMDVQ